MSPCHSEIVGAHVTSHAQKAASEIKVEFYKNDNFILMHNISPCEFHEELSGPDRKCRRWKQW